MSHASCSRPELCARCLAVTTVSCIGLQSINLASNQTAAGALWSLLGLARVAHCKVTYEGLEQDTSLLVYEIGADPAHIHMHRKACRVRCAHVVLAYRAARAV